MKINKKVYFAYKLSLFLGLISLLLFVNIPSMFAQQTFWSKQEKIPQSYDNTEEPPFLIADGNHTVHAFNSQPLDLKNPNSPKAIFYRKWTIENGWTIPNDIVADTNSMNLVGAVGDQTGKAHLIFQVHNSIYYSQAYISEASNPIAWSTPMFLGEETIPPTIGLERVSWVETDAPGNNIVVTYSGSQYGNGLYYVSSSDGGNNWTSPYPIYLTGDENIVVADPKLYAGDSGIIHAVWATRKQDGFGGPGYYSNYDVNTKIWSEPLELDLAGIISTSIVEYEGSVIVSYIRGNVILWRRSMDGGKSWTYPSQLSPRHVGSNGLVSFVVDSNDTLYAFFGQRINITNLHGMWQTIWTDYGWSYADAVVSGPKVTDIIGGNGFDPQGARAVIVNGNTILVTWCTDGSSGTNGTWYSYKKIDAPELPTKLLPVPEELSIENNSTSTEVVNPTGISTPNINPTPIIDLTRMPRNALINPQTQILIGVIPAFLLLVILMLVRYLFYINHR